MLWNDHGAPVGYDYQQPQNESITIRSTSNHPTPQPLSKANADRVREAVREIEQRERK